MSTERTTIQVGEVTVQVERKDIKNLHIGVYPPNGRVRVAAPLQVDDDAVHLAVVSRLGWVNRQVKNFENQMRQSERQMVDGESHFLLGRSFRLRLVDKNVDGESVRINRSFLNLAVPESADSDQRRTTLDRWYREQLREIAQPLFEKWQKNLEVQPSSWAIRKMKTKWGACNPSTRRIWLNVELVKVPQECIEYVVVHELVHLLVARHGERFQAILTKHLPNWKHRRELLNAQVLPHAVWTR